mmetsp:Transcript_21829/g.32683  ORF Transcript_21829/g.32683 Transcript_21829/m.32683 type:complete len:377 (-) Transcript_21829:242-1372(-)
MAFDTPLEADRPGELNLLNTLVRAPVVGTLMWIFGGDAALAEEAQLQDCSAKIATTTSSSMAQSSQLEYEDTVHDWPDMADTEHMNMNMDGNEHGHHYSYEYMYKQNNKLRRGQRDKQAGATSATAALAHIQQSTMTFDPHSTNSDDHDRDKARRQMSWSDESGQSLVEYFDENNAKNTALHERTSNCFSKPLKSAMRRSKKSLRRSGNLQPDASPSGEKLPQDQQQQQLLLHQHHSSHRVNWHDNNAAAHAVFAAPNSNKGAVSSAGANGNANSSNGGYVSPQWGWYISTTPPVEKFDSGRSKKSKKKGSSTGSSSNKDNCDVASSDTDVNVLMERMCTTDEELDSQSAAVPTFTKGVKGMGKLGKVGYWPSIPL